MASATNFNGTGGGWTLQDAWNNGASNITLTAGTLNTNGQTVTTTGTFSISGTTTRTLTLGASTITCNIWTSGTVSNLTFNADTSSITVTNGGTSAFSGGGLTYNNMTFTGTTATNNSPQITGANTFANLTRTNASGYTALRIDANQTVTGTFTVTGNNANTQRIIVRSDATGTARTITAAAVSLTNVDFQDITAAGAAAPFTGTSVGDAGGNTNITATTATTRYWVGGTGNWFDPAEWSATSGGAGGASVPLPQDDAVFDANSFSAGSQTVTTDINVGRLAKNIDWTGVTNTPTWITNNPSSIFGSVTLVSGMTLNANSDLYTFEGRGSFTLTNAGKTWAKNINLNAPGGTMTLQDAFSSGNTRTLTIVKGTFDANNNDVTFGLVSANNSNTRTVTMGSGTWTLTGTGTVWDFATVTNLTLNANTSTIKITDTSATARTFSGGGKTYNNFWSSAGASTASLTIAGSNTFADFKDDGSAAHSILFTAGTTQTVTTWNVSGSSGNLITINSTNTATHALTKAGGGTISSDFLNIQHSVATPADTWYAGANSTDNQAVATAGSGWIFTAPPSGAVAFKPQALGIMGVG